MWFEFPPSWRWRWEDMCGPLGLEVWSPEHHDLGICFQQLFLQIPVLALLAILSAYYSGRHIGFVVRGQFQMRAIRLRSLIVIVLFILPVLQIYLEVSNSLIPTTNVDIFLSVTQGVTWLVHFSYISALRRRLGMSPRGPVKICVLWTLYAVLTMIYFHSYYLLQFDTENKYKNTLKYKIGIASAVFQFLYGLTLLPSEGNTEAIPYNSRYVQIGEQSPLLGNSAFNSFHEEQDPYYLGVAMEESTVLSRLLFYWVNPLIRKGAEKRLNHPDDLYDLPVNLSCGTVSLKLDKALLGNVDKRKRPEQTGKLYDQCCIQGDARSQFPSRDIKIEYECVIAFFLLPQNDITLALLLILLMRLIFTRFLVKIFDQK